MHALPNTLSEVRFLSEDFVVIVACDDCFYCFVPFSLLTLIRLFQVGNLHTMMEESVDTTNRQPNSNLTIILYTSVYKLRVMIQ